MLCIYFDAKNKMGNGGDIFSEEVHQIKVMCFENEPIIAIFSNETTGTPISWRIESMKN